MGPEYLAAYGRICEQFKAAYAILIYTPYIRIFRRAAHESPYVCMILILYV